MSARQEAVSVGSAGVENRIAERYPPATGAGCVTVGDNEWQSNGNRPGPTDEKASPLTFVALFPYVEKPDPKLTIATAPVAV